MAMKDINSSRCGCILSHSDQTNLFFQDLAQTHIPKLVFSCQMGHCLVSVSEANEIQQTDSEQHLDSAPVDQVHLRRPLSESLNTGKIHS